jgi:hypothetical protein
MKDTKRAVRRHHRRRMIAYARRIYRSYLYDWSDEEILERARRNHGHLKKCSCWMCGNRRRWFGPTIQERRMNQSLAHSED